MKHLKLYESFLNEGKDLKYIEMTGSPKSAGFKTKALFLDQLKEHGFKHIKMSKRDNQVTFLVTGDKSSESNKMKLAEELGVEIVTYAEMAEDFNLETDA